MKPGDPVQTTMPPILTGNVVQMSAQSVFFYCEEYKQVIAVYKRLLRPKIVDYPNQVMNQIESDLRVK